MSKVFNVIGLCIPEKHYMVNLDSRLKQIKKMVDEGCYFTINRARQYGKTTTLTMLENYLQSEYCVISLDFQRLGYASFETEQIFVEAFVSELLAYVDDLPEEIERGLENLQRCTLQRLFQILSKWCKTSKKPIVLIIDEVDSATNNQVFLDFLAQLRGYYLKRRKLSTFHSVVLAGVHDVKNLKRKLRPEEEHKMNSPWNIATKFEIDMSFSKEDIVGMLKEYEEDHLTNMNINQMAELIYDYTSGYPYLVSRFCKILDEEMTSTPAFPIKSSAWTKEGFLEAEKLIIKEDNSLYQSLIGKLEQYKELKMVLYELLFTGKPIPYVSTSNYIQIATMFGFVRNEKDTLVIFNRIFEKVLYNHFISEEFITSKMYRVAVQERKLSNYLDYFHLKKGYMLSFNFNKKKEVGVKEIQLGDKTIIEAIV